MDGSNLPQQAAAKHAAAAHASSGSSSWGGQTSQATAPTEPVANALAAWNSQGDPPACKIGCRASRRFSGWLCGELCGAANAVLWSLFSKKGRGIQLYTGAEGTSGIPDGEAETRVEIAVGASKRLWAANGFPGLP